MKMSEQIFKKKTAPQYNSNSLNCKNREHRNIATLSLQLRSYKNSKNQSEIAACEQKSTSEKVNFCSNTVFSLYFKIRATKIHAA